MLANYYGVSEDVSTFLEGIVGKVSPHTRISYSQGALMDEKNRNPMDWFSGNAAETEVTIACMGISQLIEGEEGESIASRSKGDRVEVGLPESQIEFLKLIRSKAKKLVVIITAGSAVSIPEVYELADAVLYAWYPGEQGGNAAADLIFGDAVPSGRLPVTVVESLEDLPPFEDYALSNRTYRYLDKEPLFPFGYGLSYTGFSYSAPQLSSKQISSGESIDLTVTITNTGDYKGAEVVQLYLSDEAASVDVPHQALKGFQRVELWPGASKEITFTITPKMMEMINEDGDGVIEAGGFTVYVGGSSPSSRLEKLGNIPMVEASFEVR